MKIFLWFTLAIFVGFIFLEWGMKASSSRRFGMLEKGIVGRVNGIPLSYRLYNNLVARYRENDIAQGEAQMLAFNEIIQNALVEDAINKRNLALKDEEVLEIIRDNPPQELLNDTLLYTDGKFDYSKYLSILNNPQNIQWLKSYEAIIRNQLPRQMLYVDIVSTIRPTSLEIIENYIKQNLKMKIEYISFNREIKQEELKIYYETHKEDFINEEGLLVKYAFFEAVATLEDEKEALRDAEEIAKEVKRGVSLDTLARLYKIRIDEVDVDYSLKIGEVKGPIKKKNGFYIIKRVDKERCKDLVVKIRPSDEVMGRLQVKVESFLENVKAEGFKQSAKYYGIEIDSTYNKVIGGVDISHLGSGIRGPIEGNKGYYVLKIEKSSSSVQPLESVSEEMKENILMQEALKARGDFEGFAREMGLKIDKTYISMDECKLGSELFEKVASLQENEVRLISGDKGIYIIRCLNREEPSEEDIRENIGKWQEEFMRKKKDGIYREWFRNLIETAEIEDYRFKIK